MSKLFKAKKIRRMLSLVFAFTLVFTLAMSTSAAVAEVEGHKYQETIKYSPSGDFCGIGTLKIFVPSFAFPYEIIRAEVSLGTEQTPYDGDTDGETFRLKIFTNSFDDYTWIQEGAIDEYGIAYDERIGATYSLSPSEVIVAVEAEYYVLNETRENTAFWLDSITLYGTEAGIQGN